MLARFCCAVLYIVLLSLTSCKQDNPSTTSDTQSDASSGREDTETVRRLERESFHLNFEISEAS